MSIASLVSNNFITIAELLGLWIMLGSNVHLDRRTISSTRVVTILIFVEALLSSIVQWTADLDYLTYARIILTPTIHLLYPIIMLSIMDMAKAMRKRRLLFYLPILISAPLLYSTQWTHLVYWFTPDNQYIAADGIIGHYPSLLFFLYAIVFISVFAVRYARRGTAERKAILISFCVAMIGAMLQAALVIDVNCSRMVCVRRSTFSFSGCSLTSPTRKPAHCSVFTFGHVDGPN